MYKKYLFAFLLAASVFSLPLSAHAQATTEAVNESITDVSGNEETPVLPGPATSTEQQQFSRGHVIDVKEKIQPDGSSGQALRVRIDVGKEKGADVNVNYLNTYSKSNEQVFAKGDSLVIVKSADETDAQYYIVDRYRLPALAIILAVFFLLIFIFAGKRGITSFLGLGFTILVLALYIVPKIAHGGNPFIVSFIGAVMIAFVSLYLAHGFNKRTTIAVIATLITIALALVASSLAVYISALSGIGSEDAVYIQSSGLGDISLRGLFLGGIIIGLLGVLDDVTTAQSATVDELKKANPLFGVKELYTRGISVGREHITSLVNTLVLAYAGTSMPLILSLSLNIQPFWVTLNSEFLAEEIIRTLVGSIMLVIAVPLSTILAAYLYNSSWFMGSAPESNLSTHTH